MDIRTLTRALLVVIGLQLSGLAVWWIAARAGPSVQIGTFDPNESLMTFVVWSEGRADEAEFAALTEGLAGRIERVIREYSAETGMVVVREDAVLAPAEGAAVDVTGEIMRRVLDETAS